MNEQELIDALETVGYSTGEWTDNMLLALRELVTLRSAVRKILVRYNIVTAIETSYEESLQKLATRFDSSRQYVLWATEERSKDRRRIEMLEAGLQAAIVDLRLCKAQADIVNHHEKIVRNDMSWKPPIGV